MTSLVTDSDTCSSALPSSKRPRREPPTKEISPTRATDDQPSSRSPTTGSDRAACPSTLAALTAGKQEAEVTTQLDESEEAGLEAEEGEREIVAVFSRYWSHVAQLEKLVYTSEGYSGYKPGLSSVITEKKLREAVLEFDRRYSEDDDDDDHENNSDYTAVLVSSNVKESPHRAMERAALKKTDICKVWYCLTKDGDLLIIKLSSQDVHSKCVHRIGHYIANFCDQYPRVFDPDGDGDHLLQSGHVIAPDAFMQPVFPLPTVVVPLLTSPLIVELEHKHRGPKALLQILSSYFLQTPVEYCLGIKIYERTGPVVVNAQRSFAAIACLWRRHPTNHNKARLAGIWSFGSKELSAQSKSAFKKKSGILDQIPAVMLIHPALQRQIIIPGAHLVQNARDQNGNPVPVLPNGNDLTIDLDVLADICNRRLMA